MTRPTLPSDAYDVFSYESAEEFAEDMQHDREFDDYDDAAMYWEEMHSSYEYQKYQRRLKEYEQQQAERHSNDCYHIEQHEINEADAGCLGAVVMAVLLIYTLFTKLF